MQNWQCPTEGGAMSASEHSGAYSGVSQAAGELQACTRGKQSDNTHLKKKSRDLALCKNKKKNVYTTMPNKSTSYCMLCLTHSSWSKEKGRKLLDGWQYEQRFHQSDQQEKGSKQINCRNALINTNYTSAELRRCVFIVETVKRQTLEVG